MPVERLPNKVLYCQLQEGKRSQGDQTNPLQTHPLSLTKGFQYSSGVLGTFYTGSNKTALPYQKKEQLNTKQRESMKLKESAKNARQELREHH